MRLNLYILFLVLGGSLFAQEPVDSIKLNSLQFDFGMNQIKEENIHPKVHSGTIAGLSFNRHIQSKNISDLGISIRYSRVKTVYEDLSATVNAQITGDYRYLFKTFSKCRLMYAVGPEAYICYIVSYYPNWDDSHLYWANQISLGASNLFSYQISKSKTLVFDLRFSVLSFISRPEKDRQYKIDDLSFGGIMKSLNSNFESGSVDKSLRIAYQMEYQIHFNPKFTQAICYEYDYVKIKGKESFLFQANSHRLALKIYF
jgi:hypothetical protein